MAHIQASGLRIIDVRYNGSAASIHIEDAENTTIVLPLNLWAIGSLLRQLNSLADLMETHEDKKLANR